MNVIRRLRLKFIGVNMLLVTSVLLAVFFAMLSATRRELESTSMEVLERVVASTPYRLPERGDVQLPYFTVFVSGESAIVVDQMYFELNDPEALGQIVTQTMRAAQECGLVEGYDLRYLRRDSLLGTRIAYVDTTMEQTALRTQTLSALWIGMLAWSVLLAISALLARWATRPIEKTMEQQRRFLSDASHELKTPLTVILSSADLLAEGVRGDERLSRWSDNICAEGERMKELVEQMLTLARSDSVRPDESAFAPVELSAVAEECALHFEPVAYESGRVLRYTIDSGIAVHGESEHLRRLVSILLDNAVKYAPRGAAIELTLRVQDKRAWLQVANEGEKIPPEKLARLFERFYRADASRTEASSFGLGLPIAQSIAKEHHGTITAQSDERWTRFTLTMPLLKK